MQSTIERVADGSDLSFDDARTTARDLVRGEATDAQIGALLASLRAKGETPAEIAGFAQGLRDLCRHIEPDVSPLVDTCGTGGDSYDTINVSTTSAIIAASAGIPVGKHGNHAVSSASGSADVLAELGVRIGASPAAVERAIERDGIGFMHAPVFHPAMKTVAAVRSELGFRTIFNILGPLTNPAGADRQVIGVYEEPLVSTIGSAVSQLELEHALVVHGSGLDEITVHGPTTVAEIRNGTVETYHIEPYDLGLERHSLDAVAGGSPERNAAELEAIIDNERDGAKRDIVLANSGAALYVGGMAGSLEDGVSLARDAIESGRARVTLDRLCTPVQSP